MTTTAQTVEAAFTSDGVLTVNIDPPGPALEQAGAAGMDAGRRAVSAALTSAIGADVQRAAELLRVVQQADRVLAQHDSVLAVLDRQQAAASGLFFGTALDARLLELERERDAAEGKRVAALGDHSDSLQELQSIRDRALAGGVKAVARTLDARRTAAAVERQQTAGRLVALMAEHLAKLIALDAELGELGRVRADDAVTDHLEAVLPDVFSEDGLAPHTAYDWRKEREEWEEAESRRPTWGRQQWREDD